MAFRDKLARVFAFRTTPTTLVALVLYIAVFVSLLWGDALPQIPKPKNQHGLDLDWAYRDLQAITGDPHPYNSRANDQVRYHILNRVQAIASSHPRHVHIQNDLQTNVTFARSYGVYFEGTNILVKIDGTSSSPAVTNGILFSAHYDSVSTAHGATDDGMAVVTLIQLIDYFARHQPKKTVVFNINNGEEDFLSGAHAFLEHPWSKLVKIFLNLEGAGAGGRPTLFRTTSTAVARAFSNVPHPHGSSFSADAFNRGIIRSSTDYSVYSGPGSNMEGLDLAFYERRSKYHTLHDSIPGLNGKAALWNMMESALFSGIWLSNENIGSESRLPVYFDLFGEAIGIFSLTTFFVWNILMLVLGPILAGSLIFLAHRQRKLYWSRKGWARFPLAFVLGVGLSIALGVVYTYLNPYIVYSSPWLVFASAFLVSYIGIYTPIALLAHYRPVPQQKTMILTQMYILWWFLLVIDTIILQHLSVSGLYFVTFFHASTLASLLAGLVEHFELPTLRESRRLESANEPMGDDSRSAVDEDQSPTERTPLIAGNGSAYKPEDGCEENQFILWMLELVLAIPFPAIVLLQIGMILMKALPQTLADGNKPYTVYFALSVIAFFTILPSAPFIHKFSRSLFYVAVVLFLGTGVYNLFAFPFSADSALKVFFQQRIDLDSGVNHVVLTGIETYVKKHIIPELPSTFAKDIACSPDPLKPGLAACEWVGGIPPEVANTSSDKWINLNATLLSPGSALFTVAPRNSRNCRLYFDSPVTNVRVRGSTGQIQEGYPFPEKGLTELRLWSRSWERTFEVEVAWDGSVGIAGRAACEWADFSDGAVPALDEVNAFLPTWAIASKRTDGLLEGWKAFSL